MNSNQRKSIQALVDYCWKIRQAMVESGDIGAGQLLDQEFNQLLENASHALGNSVVQDRPDVHPMIESMKSWKFIKTPDGLG